MKKFKGFSIAGIIVGILVVALIGIAAFSVIDGNNKATNYDDYNFASIIKPDVHNGNIGDHVKGDPNAPVVIVEYADFQCGYCALMNPRVDKIVEKADGKLAIVYRNYLLSYHQNGTAAASAAEAAGLQGYWKEYASVLFANQDEWAYATASERTELFDKYFEEVTDGKGDLEKFNKDLTSPEVSQKISFDMGIGKRINISGTPSFYIDGELIDFGNKNGGQITVNGENFSWDHSLSNEEFDELILNIVDAKLAK
ncbi:thioredoxin domain-containing protein [Candidatus Saccharibacteria bacterium]|nr:thioredoxin domain-containing protein [Candidatus Saccharibacteria bacterium]MBR3264010.1 thioredoxin domain-containing protein [Candidatus Saccharibacteria bacterium]